MSELQRMPIDQQIGTYGTRLRARTDPRHPCNKSFGVKPRGMSEEAMDAQAEKEYQQKVVGGYQRYVQVKEGKKIIRVSNRCDSCFQLKSRNGECGCW